MSRSIVNALVAQPRPSRPSLVARQHYDKNTHPKGKSFKEFEVLRLSLGSFYLPHDASSASVPLRIYHQLYHRL